MTGTPLSQGTALPGGLVTMATPTSLAEQLLVAVQNLSNNGYLHEQHHEEGKPDMGGMAYANGNSQLLNNTNTALNNLLSGNNPQLANVLGLAGLPQMAALANIPGLANLGVVGQLAAAAQVVQAAANNNVQNGSNGLQMNGQHNLSQQPFQLSSNQTLPHQSLANTPQFILAGGQPIQGIQGAQLLIPTSSGVATQQIITIPITQMMTNQMVQLVANNGQVLTTSLANLQALNQTLSNNNSNATCTSIQNPSVINTGNYSNLNGQVPQILTNPAGQVIAINSQPLVAHSLISSNQNGNQNSVQLPNPLPAHLPAQSTSHPSSHNSHNSIRQSAVNHQNNGLNLVSPSKAQHNSDISLQQAAVNLASLQSQLSLNTSAMVAAHYNTLQNKSQLSPPSVSSTTSSLIDTGETINNTEANIVDGINLEEIKEFAKAFKFRRLSLGLTQTQVGQALSATEGPSYSQSAICRFEKLDITPKSAQRIKPVLERWMKEAEERYKNGAQNLTEFIGSEPTKKRKRRTSFTPAALDVLNIFFEKNTHPSGSEMTDLAEKLNYDREVVRVWFCNKRQALKNTIKRLKGGV